MWPKNGHSSKVKVDKKEPCPDSSKVKVDKEEPCPDSSKVKVDKEKPCPDSSKVKVDKEEPCPDSSKVNSKVKVDKEEPCPDSSKVKVDKEEPCPDSSKVKVDKEEPCPDSYKVKVKDKVKEDQPGRDPREDGKPKEDEISSQRINDKEGGEIKRIIEDDPLNRKEILALHQQLKRFEQEVEALNGKIETLLLEEEASEDLFSAELEGCGVYERMLIRMEVEVQDALYSIATIQRERNGSTSALTEKRICKLPKLELLKFSGTLREWLPWWGQFERIHKDDTLSDVDKFHYLHQAVTKGSRAQKFLEGYTVTEANYAKAREALQEKFGDKVLLTEMYVRQLLELIV
ncbi:hypothetical protein LAZ67_14001069 [Cordylochernes scorpioides]|uniref:Uncharacterized protein n=1 Tax=Cordylochernes scorpioides TaxID=51811 RepID=A0ABY6L5Z6_9ARAC|nr:hypothetical protein LAZ67_14001069 [Cordylochernes scorpioides]